MRECPDPNPFEYDSEESFILISKAALLIIFHIEGLDDPISSDGFMEKGGDGTHPLLTLPAKFPKSFSKFFNGDDGQREDEKGDERQFPVSVKDHAGQAEDGEGIFEKAGDDIGDRSLEKVDIIGNPGDKDAGGSFGEEGEGEVLKMVVKFLPHICHNPQAHKVHQVSLTIIESPFEYEEED